MVRRAACLFVLLCAYMVVGCNLFRPAPKATYETVQADPHHDTELAETEHAKALKIMSKWSDCGSGELAKAEEHLQKSLIADVTYGPAHNSLGTVYLWQHKLYLAAWEFEYASKLMSDRVEPFYNLGLLYEGAEKRDRAIEYYKMAFAIAPRNPQVLASLASAQLSSGQTVNEVRYLIEQLVLYEHRPEWIAWAHDQLGRNPEAIVRLSSASGKELILDETKPQVVPLQPAPPPPAPAVDSPPPVPEGTPHSPYRGISQPVLPGGELSSEVPLKSAAAASMPGIVEIQSRRPSGPLLIGGPDSTRSQHQASRMTPSQGRPLPATEDGLDSGRTRYVESPATKASGP